MANEETSGNRNGAGLFCRYVGALSVSVINIKGFETQIHIYFLIPNPGFKTSIFKTDKNTRFKPVQRPFSGLL